MEADEDEMARRAAATRKQLKRMFRQPPGQAYNEDGGPGQVDEEELEAELEELEEELREDLSGR
jgi:predicted  nucleic acid-binding Zn-ribbon protein